MRRWALLATSCLIATALAGCSGVGATDVSAQAPSWSPGHEWSYNWERESRMESDLERGDSWRGSDDDTVFRVAAGLEPVEGGAGWLVHRDGDLPSSFLFPGSRLLFMRESDMTPAPGDGMLDWSCGLEGACRADYDRYGATDGLHEGRFIDFPIHTGKTWTYQIRGDRFEAHVVGPAAVSVDAGRFQGIHVQYRLTQPGDDVEQMEEQGATVHRYDIDQDIVVDVHYVPEVEWVASYAVEASITFDVDIEWPDGERHTDRGHFSLHEAVHLTSFDLAEAEPMDADALAALLGLGPTTPPWAPAVVESNVTVDVRLSPETINLAREDSVVMEASATGEAASYNHTWVVGAEQAYYYPHASPGDGVEGARHEHTVDAVGRYVAVVYTYDDRDRLVDIQEVPFEAIHAVNATHACDPDVLGLTSATCGAIEFPVRTWDLGMVVEARYEGDALLGDPALVVLDARGQEVARKAMPGGEATIDAAAYGDWGVWSAHVEPPTAVGGTVEYDVRIQQVDVGFYH